MKVLLLSNSPHVGGGNISLRLLARGLVALGHEVTVAIPARGDFFELVRDDDYRVVPVPNYDDRRSRPLANWLARRNVSALLRDGLYDVVHANNLARAHQFLPSARGEGIPVVCHVRFPFSEPYARWKVKRSRQPDFWIFNSHALRTEMTPALSSILGEFRSEVIYNAVDLADYRVQYGADDGTRLAVVANLQPVKGHATLLDALAILAKRGLRPECLLIGEDVQGTGYGDELKSRAARLGLSNVEFLGYRSDVPEILAGCGVLVCPSHVEPFGRCLIEGMAAGLPVIGTAVGGIPEVLDDGRAGILVPAADATRLADAIESLQRDPEERARLGRVARQRAETVFSVEAHTAAVLGVYERLVGERVAGAPPPVLPSPAGQAT